MSTTRLLRGAGRPARSLAVLLVLLALCVAPVRSGDHTVLVASPNGTDDTAALQAALDQCVTHGPGSCTVQLAAGRYLTRQLLAYGFRGTFRGTGRHATVVEALPNLHVDALVDQTDVYWPPSAEHPWASLILFVDGDIRVSDLAVRLPHVPAAEPWYLAPGWQVGALIDAIRFMGRPRADATVERVAIEGREDPSDMGLSGFNVANGITYVGEFPKGTGVPFDYYQITGRLTVRASRFESMGAGVYPGIVRDGRVTIGGSPSDGNVFENVAVGTDLESLEGSNVMVSHNTVLGARWAASWVVPWCCGFLPTRPSYFSIRDNHLEATGEFADGIVLFDDPATPWIRAHVFGNTVEAQDIGYGGISSYNTLGTKILRNRISGHGADAIGIWNGKGALVLRNDVEDFVADFTADYSHAQIVLDGTTSHTGVVCGTPSDTVLDQGQDNRLIGCQPVAP